MAYSLNRVDLVGNLGQDPELRTFPDGGKIATLSIATTERWRDKSTGEQREATEWHRVVIRNQHVADWAAKALRKGQTVVVSGKLATRKWQDQTGADRWATEVVVSGYNGTLILPNVRAPAGDGPDSEASGTAAPGGRGGALDDEIPF
jgi:single-strand DNA-binding protein